MCVWLNLVIDTRTGGGWNGHRNDGFNRSHKGMGNTQHLQQKIYAFSWFFFMSHWIYIKFAVLHLSCQWNRLDSIAMCCHSDFPFINAFLINFFCPIINHYRHCHHSHSIHTPLPLRIFLSLTESERDCSLVHLFIVIVVISILFKSKTEKPICACQ